MIQIYQLLCLEKLVDPNIALLCKFIKDNVVLKVFIDDCYGGVSDDSLLFGRGLTRGVGNGTGDDLKLFSYHLGSGSTTSLFDRKPASMTPSIPPRDATSTTSVVPTPAPGSDACSSTFDLSAFQMPRDSKFSSRASVSIAPAPEKGVKRRKKSDSPVGSGNSPSNSSVFSAMSSVSKDTSISMASSSARRFSIASSISSTTSTAVPSLFASASAGSNCGSVSGGGSGSVNGSEGGRTAPVPITPDLVALSQKNAKKKRKSTLFDTFSQSINGSLNNGLRKLRNEQQFGSVGCKRSRSYSVAAVEQPHQSQNHPSQNHQQHQQQRQPEQQSLHQQQQQEEDFDPSTEIINQNLRNLDPTMSRSQSELVPT
ncbi:unnamed protein product [Ambrosiozyma monospora]|uniref:Unnamed protein product n=1 Tax=Ambrosiozyma monospora TaxID=43982 RepID=A0ACB5TGA5_AMBMO|nr:unnamed protein product [Ambrosiozyma monospora]